jgi:MraZ protein
VFLGEYEHSLDDKGRLVLPRKFRDELEGGCVVTQGQENCLYVFPLSQWEE